MGLFICFSGKKAGHHARSFKYDISEKSSEYSRVELVFEKTPEGDATYQLSVSIDNGGILGKAMVFLFFVLAIFFSQQVRVGGRN